MLSEYLNYSILGGSKRWMLRKSIHSINICVLSGGMGVVVEE
jgi:hypothetical protein